MNPADEVFFGRGSGDGEGRRVADDVSGAASTDATIGVTDTAARGGGRREVPYKDGCLWLTCSSRSASGEGTKLINA